MVMGCLVVLWPYVFSVDMAIFFSLECYLFIKIDIAKIWCKHLAIEGMEGSEPQRKIERGREINKSTTNEGEDGVGLCTTRSKLNQYVATLREQLEELAEEKTSDGLPRISKAQACTLVWEVRAVGWEVCYGAEFTPETGYTVIIQKSRKVSASDESVISDSFKPGEPGKVVLTFDNQTSK
ncbi:hypothetical protein Vadar_016540 [Vaccinium darrowii]|uniref:Uncharacterized protein n=1 Tax=Vaccinium darrowii TaxID=229202 RepID=A0ACB7YED4_9ERIC|nr:hypothetical protein Vadar_016540 [Vaccinium darrowii]